MIEEKFDILNIFNNYDIEISQNINNLKLTNNYTYQKFSWDTGDGQLLLGNSDKPDCFTSIDMDTIEDITFLKNGNKFDTIINIKLLWGDISLQLHGNPIQCCKCNNIINTPIETKWEISGFGNYSSYFDGEKLELDLCDNCLCEILRCNKK